MDEPRGPKPWDEALFDRRVCLDTCPHAKNGVCDDGRKGEGRVLCDLGTDCTDCGAWLHRVPASRRSQVLAEPIAVLMERGVEVYVKDTTTEPSFRMAFTNASYDTDVSRAMVDQGAVEVGLTQLWTHRMSGPRGGGGGGPGAGAGAAGDAAVCLRADGHRGLVADVGGNFGWYTLLAAAMGCRVMVWEPVPHFRAFLEYGVQLNLVMGLVDVHPAVIADKVGEQYEVIVPQRGIWGTAGIGGYNINPDVNNEGDYEKVVVRAERLDAEIKEDVAMLKIDVEGFEPVAFATAGKVLEHYTVANVMIEYSPGVYERARRWHDYDVWAKMLLELDALGYKLFHLNWEKAKTSQQRGPPSGNKGYAPLDMITKANLEHDMADARALTNGSLGCPISAEMRRKNAQYWTECNQIPVDLHPKSFHSEFSHNTNVFATLDVSNLQMGRSVGVHLPNQTDDEWFGKSGLAMGGLPCEAISVEAKVRHRCPCTNPRACGKEAAAVEGLRTARQLLEQHGP